MLNVKVNSSISNMHGLYKEEQNKHGKVHFDQTMNRNLIKNSSPTKTNLE